jgi:hypothetical protein
MQQPPLDRYYVPPRLPLAKPVMTRATVRPPNSTAAKPEPEAVELTYATIDWTLVKRFAAQAHAGLTRTSRQT